MKRIALFTLLFFMVLSGNYSSAETWQDMTGGLSDREFYAIAESHDEGGAIYVGTTSGLYRKTNADKGWKRVFACRGQYKGINHICVSTDNTIYIATKDGLYKSKDSGNNWKRLIRGLGEENYSTYVVSVWENKGTIYLGTLKGLFRTEDGGKTWEKPQGLLADSKIGSIAVGRMPDFGRFFVICNNGVYEVARNFKNYKKVFGFDSLNIVDEKDLGAENNAGDEPIFLLNNITLTGKTLYLSTNRGLFISGDAGASWARFESAGLSNRWINYILLPGTGSRIFAATKNGVFEYKEKEHLWDRIYRGMDSRDVRQLMLTAKGELWALCKRRIYMAKLDYSHILPEGPVSADRILSNFEDEPTVNGTIAMAIKYAEVHPDKIAKWRKAAKFKALLPKLSLGIDHNWSDTYEIYTSTKNSYWMYGPQDRTEGWDLNLSWDLSDLVWNESQTSIDVRSKLMVQLRDDIVNEVTRTYFERRRLQAGLLMNPPRNIRAALEKDLRVQELTAGLDGLTGGHFSRAIEKGRKR